jgi:hypothetical protein
MLIRIDTTKGRFIENAHARIVIRCEYAVYIILT